MIDTRFAPYGALVLRLSLSFFFFAHLYRKFAVTGFDPWWNGLVKQGYADWMLGYTVGAEFLGAVLLLLGIYTRTVSLLTLHAHRLSESPMVQRTPLCAPFGSA